MKSKNFIRPKNQCYPELPSNIGKSGKSVMPPDGKIIRYEIIDEVRAFQGPVRDKVVVFQLVKFENKRQEIRIGYYIIGKKPKMRGRWVWGQFAAFIPVRTFRELLRKATKRAWFPV